MFNIIINELNNPQSLTDLLKSYFSDYPESYPKDFSDDLNVVEFVKTTFYAKIDHAEDIARRLLIVPLVLEGLSPDKKLVFISVMMKALMTGLAWTEELQVDFSDSACDEQVLSEKIGRYYIDKNSSRANFTSNYLATLLAYSAIEISLMSVAELTGAVALKAQLDRAKEICEHFLSYGTSEVNALIPLFLDVFSGFPHAADMHPEKAHPSSPLWQINTVLRQLSSNEVIQSCFAIGTLSAELGPATTIQDLKDSLTKYIGDADKPLVGVWRYNSDLILSIVDMIVIEPNPRVVKIWLELFAGGLLPKSPDMTPYEYFDFLCRLYEGYADEIGVRELVLSALLSENHLFHEVIVFQFVEQIINNNDFEMAYALSLAAEDVPPGRTKKEVYDAAMKRLEGARGLATCWWHKNLHKIPAIQFFVDDELKIFPFNVENKFNDLFGWYCQEEAFKHRDKLSQFCDYIVGLTNEYRASSKPRIKSAAAFRAEEAFAKAMDCLGLLDICYDEFFKTLTQLEKTELVDLFTVMQGCPDQDVVVLIRLLTNSELLLAFFNEVLACDKTNKKIQQGMKGNELPSIFYAENYLIQLAHALSQSTSKSLPFSRIKVKDTVQNTSQLTNTILSLLVLLFREMKSDLLPQRSAWQSMIVALINYLIVIEKESALGQALTELIQSCEVHQFLPKQEQKKFLAMLGERQWLSDDDELTNLMRSLTQEEQKPKKKAKTKKSKLAAASAADETRVLEESLTSTAGHQESANLSDLALISQITATPLTNSDCEHLGDSPIVFSEALTPRSLATPSPRLMITPSPNLIALMNVAEQLPHEILPETEVLSNFEPTPCDNLREMIRGHLQKLVKLANEIERDALPLSWPNLIAEVRTEVQKVATFVGMPTITAEQCPIAYFALQISEQKNLENSWNQGLGECCWNLQREIEKFPAGQLRPELLTEFEMIKAHVEQLVLSASHCYFKNRALHLEAEVVRFLDEVSNYFGQSGLRMVCKGSLFTDPNNAGDLDLSFIPQQDVNEALITAAIMGLNEHLATPIIGRELRCVGSVLQYQVEIELVKGKTLEVDLNFLLRPRTVEQELEETLQAFLSACAVNWDVVEGHALMKVQTARSICCASPVLKLLALPPEDKLIELSGYFVKNIMKFQHFRRDPFLKEFMQQYITPQTRHLSFFVVSAELHEKNQVIIKESLWYLLKRFHHRPEASMRFILENNLLQIPTLFSQSAYERCHTYFNQHFMTTNQGYVVDNVSSSIFLAMFFLPLVIDIPNNSALTKEMVLEGLRRDYKSIQAIMGMTIMILKALPTTTIELYALTVNSKAQQMVKSDLSVKERALLTLLQSWHSVNLLELETSVDIKATSSNEVIPMSRADLRAKISGQAPVQADRSSRFFTSSRTPEFTPFLTGKPSLSL